MASLGSVYAVSSCGWNFSIRKVDFTTDPPSFYPPFEDYQPRRHYKYDIRDQQGCEIITALALEIRRTLNNNNLVPDGRSHIAFFLHHSSSES